MASKKARYWIGFDLGGTKMLATVYNRQFKALGSRRRKTKDFRGAREGVAGIVKTIEDALQDAKAKPAEIGGIGVGCPGVLNLQTGSIVQAPNLGWRNVPLQQLLQRKFSCPVVIANDVDAGTYGEYKFGAGQQARCVLGVFPGTGIGGGLVYEGKLFRGTIHSCMEIGHIHMQAKGHLCGCGRWGCLETVASRLAIAAEAAEAAYRGDAPSLRENAGTDISAIRSRALARAITAGDASVEEIVRHGAKYLGVGIASTVNLLAPDVVVLGGGLMEALPTVFLREVREAIRQQAMKPFRHTVKVVAAKLGDDAGVMGSAALAADHGAHR